VIGCGTGRRLTEFLDELRVGGRRHEVLLLRPDFALLVTAPLRMTVFLPLI